MLLEQRGQIGLVDGIIGVVSLLGGFARHHIKLDVFQRHLGQLSEHPGQRLGRRHLLELAVRGIEQHGPHGFCVVLHADGVRAAHQPAENVLFPRGAVGGDQPLEQGGIHLALPHQPIHVAVRGVFIAEGGHILQRRVPVQGLDALLVLDVVHLHVRLKAHIHPAHGVDQSGQ